MRSVAPMRTAKIGYIVISVLLCALGILLIAVPEFSISAVGVICGAILIVFGIVRLVGYFSKDLYRLAFQYDLAFGIMMIALGVIMLWHPGSLMNLDDCDNCCHCYTCPDHNFGVALDFFTDAGESVVYLINRGTGFFGGLVVCHFYVIRFDLLTINFAKMRI